MATETPLDSGLVCFAINAMATGPGPVATPETLKYFMPAYVRACLEGMAADRRIIPEARAAARATIAYYK